MSLVIDCHGHYTTAPKALEDWRNRQIASIQDPANMPHAAELKISDDDLRHSIETNHKHIPGKNNSKNKRSTSHARKGNTPLYVSDIGTSRAKLFTT